MKGVPAVGRTLVVLAILIASTAPALAGDFGVVGQTGVVKKAGNGFPCFPTKGAYDAFWSAKAAGDRYGMTEAERGAVILRPGWRVRVLRSEVGFLNGGHTAVRLESGPKSGTACWVKFNPAGIMG